MSTTATLEDALAKIAADNGLTVVSVGMNLLQEEASRFDVCVHWNEPTLRGRVCEIEHGATITEALTKALAAAAATRMPKQIPTLAEAA